MYKKFEIKRTKIKGGCQSGRKVVTHNSKSDLPVIGKKILARKFKIKKKARIQILKFFTCEADEDLGILL